ncbi:MAG: MBL fold metallo-hydrolase [Candidatus Omnitrophica bacterium]|nr:MBL fold metallo-hydrolase [Candidatus Omnitrophota bacterium]
MGKDFMVKQFSAGSCYSYVLSSQRDALIIDPHISLVAEYTKYLEKNNLRLKHIIDTHTHADHFSSAAILKEKSKAIVLMHEKAVSEVADDRLKDGDNIKLGTKELKVIYAPGHTDDTINIYGEDRVFTGDVLLIGSVGRTDFQNGSHESMFDTLQNLKALPDKTVVFPAHDYNGKKSSTISQEKETNPFMKEDSKEAFVESASSKVLPKPFNIENIIRVNQKGEAKGLKMVTPSEVKELASRDSEVQLLDVRSPLEYSEMHIKDSVNIPIDMLLSKVKELSESGKSYIVFCRTGNRSPMAADMLLQSGIRSVRIMEGGTIRWKKERFPVIEGAGGISLERQVRIIAGSLVLTGIILAWLVNLAFIWISVWVSCGLIFAGITNSCLMGILLMKLSYNKKIYKSKTGGGTCSISQ